MPSPAYLSAISACILTLSTLNCDKILFITHHESRSHFSVFEPIIEGLAARDHNVTVQTFFKPKPHPNIKLEKLRRFELFDKMKVKIEEEISKGAIARLRSYIPFATLTCEHYLTDDTTRALVSQGKQFDLVIVDELFPECTVSVASLLGKNTMYLSTSVSTPWLPSPTPAPPSYLPNSLESYPEKMSFWQRMQNGLILLVMKYVKQCELNPAQQEVISKHFPQAPRINDAHNQVAFRLTNADPVMQSARPSMPNVAHCGGMHCTQPKPLPKDLNEFVESSGKDGFVVFSLGSMIKSEMLNKEFQQAFISAFSRLKQKVIWKFDSKLEKLPQNIKVVNWIPQQDLLGHPKIRLFVTHAGLLSLQEAIYHGVPVIAIPLFAEQPGNAARVQDIGIGETVSFLNVTADGLYHLIKQVLNNRSYKEKLKKYSLLFRDQPGRPVDKAIYWTEYVIRHEGALHLQSAGEELNFFQYFLLDVVAFLFLLIFCFIGSTVYLIKLILLKICHKNKTEKDEVKKKN